MHDNHIRLIMRAKSAMYLQVIISFLIFRLSIENYSMCVTSLHFLIIFIAKIKANDVENRKQ